MKQILVTAISIFICFTSCKKAPILAGTVYKGNLITTNADGTTSNAAITFSFKDNGMVDVLQSPGIVSSPGTWRFKTETTDQLLLDWNAFYNYKGTVNISGKSAEIISGPISVTFFGDILSASLNLNKQ
jgi:hypothetical protein